MKKMLFSIFGVIGLVIVTSAAVIGFGLWALQPVTTAATAKQRFVIPRGQAIKIIAQRLADEGLIRQPLAFQVYLKLNNLESKIQAGSFELSASSSASDIARRLTMGTDDIWVTIPEGWRKEEIADSLARQELPFFDKEAFLELAAASEGQLFPDTYLVSRDATAESIYYLLTNTFEQKVVKGLADELAASTHSLDEIIIMASLLEREATGSEQMKHVAGILWNRIEIGMPLQVDATLQYSKGYDKAQQSWWSQPLAADKQLNSPYNTYKNPGLPLGPIANPGIEAIQAAIAPAKVDDLFYIHDRSGQMHYAKTLEQHNANVQKYLR